MAVAIDGVPGGLTGRDCFSSAYHMKVTDHCIERRGRKGPPRVSSAFAVGCKFLLEGDASAHGLSCSCNPLLRRWQVLRKEQVKLVPY